LNTWWWGATYWLVVYYAMATVVLAAGLIPLWSIRQPARRLAVARSTLLLLLCMPPLALLAKSANGVSAVPDLERTETAEVCDCGISQATVGGRMPTLVAIHATGSGLVVVWLALGALAAARLGTRTAEAPASLRRVLKRVVAEGWAHPRLRIGGVTQPVALGLFRPTIVLPDWFVETEPEARVEAALAHEWAHLRRGDLWTLAASRLLFVLLFAHPLFYVLRRCLRVDQELIADAEAAGPRGNVAYAEALVGWARRTSGGKLGSSLGLLGPTSLLRKRVTLLLDAEFRVEPTCPRGWTAIVRGFTAALMMGLSLLALTGTARAALSAFIPTSPVAMPHTHASDAAALICPSNSALEGLTGVYNYINVTIKCETSAK
jgi:beta-lactamase regulating signal transducer with metallopeptidase domain